MTQCHYSHTDDGTKFTCKQCGLDLTADDWGLDYDLVKEPCPKATPPWSKWSINQALLDSIRKHFGTKDFTNKDAYVIYAEEHATPYAEKQNKLHPEYIFHPGNPKDPMLQMNVRNTLCKAAYPGIDILIRLGPGHYKFPEA